MYRSDAYIAAKARMKKTVIFSLRSILVCRKTKMGREAKMKSVSVATMPPTYPIVIAAVGDTHLLTSLRMPNSMTVLNRPHWKMEKKK